MALSRLDERSMYQGLFTLVRAANEHLWLKDAGGTVEQYLDLISAYGACNFGHCNPAINPFRSVDMDLAAGIYPAEADEIAARLARLVATESFDCLFQVGGSMAVTASLAIAQRVRPGAVLHLGGSFHGLGVDSLSATDAQRDTALQNTPLLDSLRTRFHKVKVGAGLGDLPVGPTEISAFVFEPVQGANGYRPVPGAWLGQFVRELRGHGVVVIADEIQSGMYRHGVPSVCRQAGIPFDIILLGKSLTNGLYPMSAVLYDQRFHDAMPGELFQAHTFQTSALGCLAIKEVLNFIERFPVDAMARQTEAVFASFRAAFERRDLVEEVHVTGPSFSFGVRDGRTKAVVLESLKKKVLIFAGGMRGERIRLAPPITIASVHLRTAMEGLLHTLDALAFQSGAFRHELRTQRTA